MAFFWSHGAKILRLDLGGKKGDHEVRKLRTQKTKRITKIGDGGDLSNRKLKYKGKTGGNGWAKEKWLETVN